MDPEVSLAANSTSWKAIASDGSLIAPGTSGSLKYDFLSSKITLTDGTVTDDGSTSRGTGYKDLALASGLTAPELVKALILYPDEPQESACRFAVAVGPMVRTRAYSTSTSITCARFPTAASASAPLFAICNLSPCNLIGSR